MPRGNLRKRALGYELDRVVNGIKTKSRVVTTQFRANLAILNVHSDVEGKIASMHS